MFHKNCVHFSGPLCGESSHIHDIWGRMMGLMALHGWPTTTTHPSHRKTAWWYSIRIVFMLVALWAEKPHIYGAEWWDWWLLHGWPTTTTHPNHRRSAWWYSIRNVSMSVALCAENPHIYGSEWWDWWPLHGWPTTTHPNHRKSAWWYSIRNVFMLVALCAENPHPHGQNDEIGGCYMGGRPPLPLTPITENQHDDIP